MKEKHSPLTCGSEMAGFKNFFKLLINKINNVVRLNQFSENRTVNVRVKKTIPLAIRFSPNRSPSPSTVSEVNKYVIDKSMSIMIVCRRLKTNVYRYIVRLIITSNDSNDTPPQQPRGPNREIV